MPVIDWLFQILVDSNKETSAEKTVLSCYVYSSMEYSVN